MTLNLVKKCFSFHFNCFSLQFDSAYSLKKPVIDVLISEGGKMLHLNKLGEQSAICWVFESIKKEVLSLNLREQTVKKHQRLGDQSVFSSPKNLKYGF